MGGLNILVTGSIPNDYLYHQQDQTAAQAKFEKFCFAIGAALARKGDQLTVLSDYTSHVDANVFRGYASVASKSPQSCPPVRITYGDPKDPENSNAAQKFTEVIREFPSVRTENVTGDGEYPFNRVAIIREVTAVIVIGGAESAKMIVEIANALGKTIIPISIFGGVGTVTWSQVKSAIQLVVGQSTNSLIDPSSDVTDQRADEVLIVLKKMVSALARGTALFYPFVIGIEVVLIIIWFAILLNGAKYSDVAIPLALVCMAIFGIVMRALIRLLGDENVALKWKTFSIEAGIGVGLALIYYILFMLGGSSIAADIKQSLTDDKSFRSICLIISLLAFGVSFLLEDTIQKITKKLAETTKL